jgi:protein SCO1/2
VGSACDLESWPERGSASRSNARNPTVTGDFEDEDEDEDERLTTGLNHTRRLGVCCRLAKKSRPPQFVTMHRFSVLCSVVMLGAFSAVADVRTFDAKGVVVGLIPEEKSIEIRHEAISNYMGAMTMPFDVRDTNELAGLRTNDVITFKLVVTETNGWVEGLRKTGEAVTNAPEPNPAFRKTRDVEPLNEGDILPNAQFTNQLGAIFNTADFNGQALGITFLFTRCPFPTYCPLMANNFSAVQKILIAKTNTPTNWHLLTISFDPEFDTPDVLKSYGQSHRYDSRHWTFGTGSVADVTAFGEQFGLMFWRDQPGGLPSHNLRTVVIDASGRVQKIYVGNGWTPEEFAEEMLRAAGRAPEAHSQ